MADSLQNSSDSDLLRIIDQLSTALASNPANYPSITAAMMSDLDAARDSFADKLTAHVAAQAQAKSKMADKEDARVRAEALARSIRKLCKASGVADAHIVALGIPSSPDGAPAATVPLGSVDTSQRLRHTIAWKDAASLDKKTKPRGSMGAEIWVKLGDPAPASEKDCTFLTLDAATPFVAEYKGEDAGKMAHYMLRWRMRDGSVGGWGETVSATITG